VVNPFGETASASVRQAIYDTNYNGLWTTSTTSVTGADVTASRSLLQLDGGQMSIAVGAAMRKEKLDIAPVDANQKFLVSGFGAAGVPLSKDRTVASAFTELNVPVLKNLELNGALRYDRYEKVGSTVNPKASLRWQPLQPLLVRASFGKGFRAPTLNDLYSPPSRGITTNGSRDLVRCPPGTSGIVDCSTQFVTLSQGVDTLKPEKSVSRSLGFLFEPNKDISAGIDFFDVEVNDIIRTDVSTTTILANPTLYASYILRGTPDSNPSGVGPIVGINQLLVNGGRTKVTGFDVDFKARVLNTATDKVTFRLAGTYVSQYAQQNSNGTYTDSVNSAAQAALGIGVILRWRNTSGLTWDNGPYSVTLSRNYQNRYQDDLRNLGASSPIQARFVEAYTTFDLQGSYTGFKSIKLTGGIKNLLDKDPPYTNYGAGFVGSYDLSYTDVRGRFAYVSATYTF
jgi:iron complex outermembrane receptor protein